MRCANDYRLLFSPLAPGGAAYLSSAATSFIPFCAITASMEHIFLPTSIELVSGDTRNTGKIIVTPCHQGYGTTLGNALRRVLLSSLPGAAAESVRIAGVQHEFSTLAGVQDDVIEIILNVKQLAVRSHAEETVLVSVYKKGVGAVRAGDIAAHAAVEILNPELILATITDPTTVFEMDIAIGRGRGYVPAEEKPTRSLPIGTIAIDSLYTPIRDVGYQVEMTRVGDVTDYEKLTLAIETNGTITPKEAVSQATKILIDHFSLLLSAVEKGESAPPEIAESEEAQPPESDFATAAIAEESGDAKNRSEEENAPKTKKSDRTKKKKTE